MDKRLSVSENARPSAEVCHPLHVSLMFVVCIIIESNTLILSFRHCMVYHMPTMLEKYGNLKQFSGQGTTQ